jgi:hypothetical protein
MRRRDGGGSLRLPGRAGPGTFFTSVTPLRFVGERVVLEAVLPGLCDQIANKANTRGWCDCRSPASSRTVTNEDQRRLEHRDRLRIRAARIYNRGVEGYTASERIASSRAASA